ncbi:MAG TPA: MarR family transcriptional regulator [Candidatus Saccharimonadales bacterium]|nr:MarR family transcriptional regulator [Candidatus Saccharimonadales bacterium]
MEKDLDALEQAMSQLHRALSRHRRWEHIALQAGVDLDRTSAAVLQSLARPETSHCKLHEIAGKLGIEAAAITRKAQLLEQAGLLRRKADQKDGRAYVLSLTAAGKKIATRLHNAKRRELQAALAGWTAADRATLARLVKKLADSLEPAATKLQ